MSQSALPYVVALASVLSACATATRSPSPAPTSSGNPALAEDATPAAEKAAIEIAVARSLPALRACYARALALNPKMEQALTVQVLARGDGSFRDVSVDLSDAREAGPMPPFDGASARCLQGELRTWHLPRTTWHGEVRINAAPVFVVKFNLKDEEVPIRVRINEVVWQRIDDAKACWVAFLQRRPAGSPLELHVHVFVGDRKVRDVTLDGAGQADAAFDNCLVTAMRRLDFAIFSPEPFDFRYPLTFSPSDP